VRTHAAVAQNRTTELCYIDDTYASGWKISTGPGFTQFQLGRPPGSNPGQGAVAVNAAGTLRPDVWHQIVAELDGDHAEPICGREARRIADVSTAFMPQPATPASAQKAPELDFGGLTAGARTEDASVPYSPGQTPVVRPRRAGVYSRVLSSDEVASDFAVGSPKDSPDAQASRREQELARQEQLDSIAIRDSHQ